MLLCIGISIVVAPEASAAADLFTYGGRIPTKIVVDGSGNCNAGCTIIFKDGGPGKVITGAEYQKARGILQGLSTQLSVSAPPTPTAVSSGIVSQAEQITARAAAQDASKVAQAGLRRGILSFAEKLALRGPWANNPAFLLASADIAIWSNNVGYIKQLFGRGGNASTGGPWTWTERRNVTPIVKGGTLSTSYVLTSQGVTGPYTALAPTNGFSISYFNPNTQTSVAEPIWIKRPGTGGSTCTDSGELSPQVSGYVMRTFNGVGGYKDGNTGCDSVGYVPFETFDPVFINSLPADTSTFKLAGNASAPAARTAAQLDADTDTALKSGTLSDDEQAAFAAALNQSVPPTFNVPDCAGLVQTTCQAAMDAAGFTNVTFTTATFSTADVTKPAGAVLSQSPAAGTVKPADAAITVTVNPADANMPRLVPAPAAHETYDAYLARLQALGLVGSRSNLSDANVDPARGPNEAVRTDPASGSKVANGAAVTVYTNGPDVAPVAGTTPSGPAVHSINLDPLKVTSPCNVFPFGVPCWIASSLGAASSTGVCPSWSQGLPFGQTLNVDGCTFGPAVAIYKPVMLWASFIGLAWLLFNVAMGRSGGDD